MKRKNVKFVLLISLAIVFAAYSLVAAADYKIGSSIRYELGYTNYDEDWAGHVGAGAYHDLFNSEVVNSRINFKANVDNASVFVEFALPGGGLRHAYASYKLNDNTTILAGQTWSVFGFNFAGDKMHGTTLFGYGDIYGGRPSQLRLETTALGGNMLKLALLHPGTTLPVNGVTSGRVNVLIPQIEGSYALKFSNISVVPSFSVRMVKAKNVSVTGEDETYTSYGVELGFKVPATEQLTLSGSGYYGQNLGVYPLMNKYANYNTVHYAVYDSTDLKNATGMGGYLNIAVAAGPGKLNIGAGADIANNPSDTGESSTTKMGAYGNYLYKLGPNFFIAPEIQYHNAGKDFDGTEHGSRIDAGIYFQYDI